MGFIKVGYGEYSIEAVQGKTLDQLKEDFPNTRIEILKEIHKQVGKKKTTKK
jgi:hypothetical protein